MTVILVSFEVGDADNESANLPSEEAQRLLMRVLPRPNKDHIVCWWVAEDDRIDGSDNDSAVFVEPGAQFAAWEALMAAGLTADRNNPRRQGGPLRFDMGSW